MSTEDEVLTKDATPPPPTRTKRKRWGERPATNTAIAASNTATTEVANNTNTTTTADSTTTTNNTNDDPKAKLLAMQESIRARLAAAKAALPSSSAAATTATATSAAAASGLLKRPWSPLHQHPHPYPHHPDDTPQQQQQQRVTKKAKVYDVDLTVTAPTFQTQNNYNSNMNSNASSMTKRDTTSSKTKATETAVPKSTNPYLSHHHESDQNNHDDDDDNNNNDDTALDPRLQRTSKIRKRHKEFHFITPGTLSEMAATKREKATRAMAAGFLSGRKTGHTIVAPSLVQLPVADRAIMMTTSATTTTHEDTLDDNVTATPRPEWDNTTSTMPLAMEWWDIELLPAKLKQKVAAAEQELLLEHTTRKTKIKSQHQTDQPEAPTQSRPDLESGSTDNNVDQWHELRQKCYELASPSYCKTATLVQHIVPIQPTNLVQAQQNQKTMVLHLTKKELKRQRKLRRQQEQREQQDLQAAGLLPAPEPRLTLRNFIQVLGDQAYLDPSQIELKVQEQMLARQRAHLQRNELAKLTPAQRAAKLARKLTEDTTKSVTTAIFYVKDLSHPYHRTKVDLNAQQWNLSGGVIECTRDPSFACVLVEGGPKAIQRYTRLMLVRMKWSGPDDAAAAAMDDDDDAMEPDHDNDDEMHPVTHKFNPHNVCHAIWQGLSIKRVFQGFTFHVCPTHEQGRKLFKTKGVAHYWDQVLQYALSVSSSTSASSVLQLKLYKDEDGDHDDHNNGHEDMNVS